MVFAPVCIPTLNRYEHLQKCLESLSRCTFADQTEVYVALDYPPLDAWEKYAPGWEKNKEYLHSCGNMGFKKLHIIERTENYGIWRPGDKGNSRCLTADIREKYDRYIISEDDNVFAPCFLEYMDKGLEMFKDDDDVISITGYKLRLPQPLIFDSNTYVRQTIDYNAWGIGLWTEKEKKKPKLDYHWYRKHLRIQDLIKLKKKGGLGAVCQLINLCCARKRTSTIDVDMWTYVALTDQQQILPSQTLVENIGFDGSGCTMGNSIGQDWCNPNLNPLSADEHFEFIGTGYEHFDENLRIYAMGKYFMSHNQYRYILFKKIVKLLIHWWK